MYYWWSQTWSLMWSFWRSWKVSLEPKTHLTWWTYLVDAWKGELAFLVVTETSNSMFSNFAILTTLYETVWELLHVFYDIFQSPQEWTCEGGNSGLRLGVSSRDASRWPIGQRQGLQMCKWRACSSCVNFSNSNYVIRLSKNIHVYDVMNGEQPMC